ncbi:hypothetical protein CMQ_799 [Grosmannia clavigera kw1407]|uniref:Uncharacterized protein n=1 Tax=Grosmannia clavigera (strain kw1407 / UAMH 11150) TaxID=655863 RepID=F0XEL2_GROCL|nr:uncharacterized protein CMQ_799 [Grosmannia clavigera kw1407]EFX03871.1 hypothetical protein CMQ_799 [Grosmannia clavigera kw1407]
MSDPPCYAAAGRRLDPRFLPCGNPALALQACCWQGDTCLVHGACFGVHDGSYITYLAGCTDADYGALACPPKGSDALADADAWVGLAYCNGSSDQWQACRQPGRPTVLAAAGPCVCPSAKTDRTVGVAAGPTLPATASLPLLGSGTISWVPPYGQGSTSVSALSRSGPMSAFVSAPTAGSASSTSTSNPSSTTSHPHTQLILGTCVGIGGSLLTIAVLLAILAVRQWRRRLPAPRQTLTDKTLPPLHPSYHPEPVSPLTVSELEPCPARPWSLRSELEDSSVHSQVRSSIGTAMWTRSTLAPASMALTIATTAMTPARECRDTGSSTETADTTLGPQAYQGLAELE